MSESAIFSSTGFLFIRYVQQLEAHCLAHALHLLCQCASIDACLIQLGLKEFFPPPAHLDESRYLTLDCVITSLSVMFLFNSVQPR